MDSETALMHLTGQRVVKKRVELNCCHSNGYGWVLENGTEFRFLPEFGILEASFLTQSGEKEDRDDTLIPFRAHEVHDVNFRILSVVKAEDGKSFLLRVAVPKMNADIDTSMNSYDSSGSSSVEFTDTDGDEIKFQIGEDQSLVYYVGGKLRCNQVSKLWVDRLPNGDFKVHVKGPPLNLNGNEVSSRTTIPSSTGHAMVDKILEMFKSSTANEGGGVLAQGTYTPEEEHQIRIHAVGNQPFYKKKYTWKQVGYVFFCCPCLCVAQCCRDDRHFGKFVEWCDVNAQTTVVDYPCSVRLESKCSSMPILSAEAINRV